MPKSRDRLGGGGDYDGSVAGSNYVPCTGSPTSCGARESEGRDSADVGSLKPPKLTCRSWLVADASTGEPLLWHEPTTRLQVCGLPALSWILSAPRIFRAEPFPHVQPASITKVVTALVILELRDKVPRAQRQKFLNQRVPVSAYASSFAFWNAEYGWNSGTNAKLRTGEIYTVRELLYALMLPSGNDAAIALAEFFGPRFEQAGCASDLVDLPGGCSRPGAALRSWPPDHPIARFVAQMNRCIRRWACPPPPLALLVALHKREQILRP
jgi:hypothetical protein